MHPRLFPAQVGSVSFWDGKKVLVTGGSGFVGSHLIEQLLAAGKDARVTAADNFSHSGPDNLAAVADRIKVEKVDLGDPRQCDGLCSGQDVVMHLAARVRGVAYNQAHPATMFRENVRMTSFILEAAQKAGVERVLVVSSACVYPSGCTIPTPESEGFSGCPDQANDGYGWAKRMAEYEAMAMRKEFGLRSAIVRPYNCYGPRDRFDEDSAHVIPSLIRRFVSGEDPVTVWGDGSQTRAFLFVEDFARGLVEITERYAECDPVNLGTDEEISIRDLVALVRELCGSGAKVRFDPSKPSGQARRNCDTAKARLKAGFQARVPLREGLKRTIDWYRRNIHAS
ncbi:MAG: NAD-dependent epimerase/dehydratase family protein [Elusimicrobia bacterium]|nr:NAD-dependent epimerase/dehydratase family protein [Elusimicrobiota bacterium]